MATNTRTVLIWFNNGEERLTLPVNPKNISFARPQNTHTFTTVNGETVHTAGGTGLASVAIETFLPGENSPFFAGVAPVTALSMLRRWQHSRRPVRLFISDTDVNDAFLITRLTEGLREGDGDIDISVQLEEYKFVTLSGATTAATGAGGLTARADERSATQTHTVRAGDTLWDIARRYYGDGARWREIATKNGIRDPKQLPIGKVLSL
jgi:LysM repeat protein